jgi:hypothetical protein
MMSHVLSPAPVTDREQGAVMALTSMIQGAGEVGY